MAANRTLRSRREPDGASSAGNTLPSAGRLRCYPGGGGVAPGRLSAAKAARNGPGRGGGTGNTQVLGGFDVCFSLQTQQDPRTVPGPCPARRKGKRKGRGLAELHRGCPGAAGGGGGASAASCAGTEDPGVRLSTAPLRLRLPLCCRGAQEPWPWRSARQPAVDPPGLGRPGAVGLGGACKIPAGEGINSHSGLPRSCVPPGSSLERALSVPMLPVRPWGLQPCSVVWVRGGYRPMWVLSRGPGASFSLASPCRQCDGKV